MITQALEARRAMKQFAIGVARQEAAEQIRDLMALAEQLAHLGLVPNILVTAAGLAAVLKRAHAAMQATGAPMRTTPAQHQQMRLLIALHEAQLTLATPEQVAAAQVGVTERLRSVPRPSARA